MTEEAAVHVRSSFTAPASPKANDNTVVLLGDATPAGASLRVVAVEKGALNSEASAAHDVGLVEVESNASPRPAERPARRPRRGLLRRGLRRIAAACAPLISIRFLFILSAVLQVTGACAFAGGIAFFLSQRNVETMSFAFISELHTRLYEMIRTYLDVARLTCTGIAADASAARITQAGWRSALEDLSSNFDRLPSVALGAVMFADGWYVGSERCEVASGCLGGTRVTVGNKTHYMYFEAGRRGQPVGLPSTTLALTPLATAWYNATVSSPTGSSWFGVRYGYSAVTSGDPLNGMVVSFATAFRLQPTIESELGSGTGLPGTPQGPPGPATPQWFLDAKPEAGPVGGAAAVNIRLAALSRLMEAAITVPGTRLILTTATGRMVASSTRALADVVDAKLATILATESPDALARDLTRQFAASPPSSSFKFWSGGREYFAGRAPVRVEPNLDLVLYSAVPIDVVMADLRRAVTINLAVNFCWLAICVTVAVLASWAITRPIANIRASMQILLETMTSVYAELRMHVEGAPSLPERRGSRRNTRSSGGSHSSSSGKPLHLRELTAFDDLVSDMHTRFVAFQEVVSTEAKMKIEMEVRSEETKKFLATVSHEMRTPLNGMLGMLDLARECELPREAAEYVEAAALSGDHLLALVNDILDLQKMEAGLIELSSAPVDVRAAVVNAVRIVKRKADEKGLAVSMDVADSVPVVVMADPDRLRQVLLNLLSNAVKYTPAGSIAVQVSIPRTPASPIRRSSSFAAREAPSSPRAGRIVLRFDVVDTGPGIAKEHQMQLFQRFFRVQHLSGAQSDPGGTGLGLAISREIVEKAGGRIGCSSVEGQGSRFWFELPCRYERSPPPSDGVGNVNRGTPPSGPGTLSPRASMNRRQSSFPSDGSHAGTTALGELGERPSVTGSTLALACAAPPMDILVAEDNAMSARVVTSMLRKEGHRVTLVSNGAEAVARFGEAAAGLAPGEAAFGVIFMDCLMPVMDGYEATGRIRAIEAERRSARHFVVALTAKATAEDAAECLRAGMDRYLPKPVRRATLAAMLEERAAMGPAPGPGGPSRAVSHRAPARLEPVETIAEGDGAGGASGPSSRRESNAAPSSRRESNAAPSSRRESNAAPSPRRESTAAASVRRSSGQSADPAARRDSRYAVPGLVPEAERPAEGGGGGERERPEDTFPGPDEPLDSATVRSGYSTTTARSRGGILSFGSLAIPPAPASSDALGSPSVSSPGRFLPPEQALDVLVVDDVEMNRRVLCTLLAKEGHRVACACDGLEAAELFERRAREGRGAGPPGPVFHCVFMDVSMPVMDGYGSTRRMRATERALGLPVPTPIVACTALSSSTDREDMASSGMDDLIVKPVGRAKVVAALGKWTGSKAHEGSRRGGSLFARHRGEPASGGEEPGRGAAGEGI